MQTLVHLKRVRHAIFALAAVAVVTSAVPWWLAWIVGSLAVMIVITHEDRWLGAHVAPNGGEMVWALMQMMSWAEQIAAMTIAIGFGLGLRSLVM